MDMDVCQWTTLISVYFGQRNSNNLATVCSVALACASENSFSNSGLAIVKGFNCPSGRTVPDPRFTRSNGPKSQK